MKITPILLFLCSAGLTITLPSSPAQGNDSNSSPAGQTLAPTEPGSLSIPPSDPATAPPTTDEESSGEKVWSSKPLLTIILVLLGIAFVYFMRRAGSKVDY